MKILLIQPSFRAKTSLSSYLENAKIEVTTFQYEVVADLLEYLSENIDNYKVVIFDRIVLKFKLFAEYFVGRDWFFILDSHDQLLNLGEVDSTVVLRIYFTPLNHRLLLDDLRSVAQVKEYLLHGELHLNSILFNLECRTLAKDKTQILLKNKEYQLLLYMAQNRGRVLSRLNILENVWDMNSQILTNTVDVHVSKLRKIFIKEFGDSSLIKTIPCAGYMLQ